MMHVLISCYIFLFGNTGSVFAALITLHRTKIDAPPCQATEYARQRGLPRVYIACNSGARVGLVEEIMPKLRAFGGDRGAAAWSLNPPANRKVFATLQLAKGVL